MVAALILLGIVAATAIVYWLVAAGPGPEQRLERLCRGDAEQARRMMAHEMKRAPGLSQEQAAARAIEALERDNR